MDCSDGRYPDTIQELYEAGVDAIWSGWKEEYGTSKISFISSWYLEFLNELEWIGVGSLHTRLLTYLQMEYQDLLLMSFWKKLNFLPRTTYPVFWQDRRNTAYMWWNLGIKILSTAFKNKLPAFPLSIKTDKLRDNINILRVLILFW